MRRACVRFSLILLSLALLPSCASYFKRKDCEKTDWFQYGQSVAMQGRRLTGDAFVEQCHKVEAEINEAALDSGFKKGMADYCKPDTVYLMGKRGEFFTPDLCEGERPKLLMQKHTEGVRVFCEKSNGYTFGTTGKSYNNICPKDLEAGFMNEFKRGRKVYLTTTIHQKEREIDDTDRDISGLERRRTDLTVQLSGMRSGTVVTRERTYDPVTRSYKEQSTVGEDPASKSRREQLERDIQSVDRDIHGRRERQRALREQIRGMQAEMMSL